MGTSIKARHHLIFGHRRKIVQIDAFMPKLLTSVRRHQYVVFLWGDRQLYSSLSKLFLLHDWPKLTMAREIKQPWHLFRSSVRMTRVRKSALGIPQLVKERMTHGIDCRETLRWCILQERRNQINSIVRCFTKHLLSD